MQDYAIHVQGRAEDFQIGVALRIAAGENLLAPRLKKKSKLILKEFIKMMLR